MEQIKRNETYTLGNSMFIFAGGINYSAAGVQPEVPLNTEKGTEMYKDV